MSLWCRLPHPPRRPRCNVPPIIPSGDSYVTHLDVKYNPMLVLAVGETVCAYSPAACCRTPPTDCREFCGGTAYQNDGVAARPAVLTITDKSGSHSWLNKKYSVVTPVSRLAVGAVSYTYSTYQVDASGTPHFLEETFNPENIRRININPCGGVRQYSNSSAPHNRFTYDTQYLDWVTPFLYCTGNYVGSGGADYHSNDCWLSEGFEVPPGYPNGPDFLLELMLYHAPVAMSGDCSDLTQVLDPAYDAESWRTTCNSTCCTAEVVVNSTHTGQPAVIPLFQYGCNPLRMRVVNYPLQLIHSRGGVNGIPLVETKEVVNVDLDITESYIGCPGLLGGTILYWSLNGAAPQPLTPTTGLVRGLWNTPSFDYTISATPINFPQYSDGNPTLNVFGPSDHCYREKVWDARTKTLYQHSGEPNPPSQRVLWYVSRRTYPADINPFIGYTASFSCSPLDVTIVDLDGNTHRITSSYNRTGSVIGVVGYNVQYTKVLVQANSDVVTSDCVVPCEDNTHGPVETTTYDMTFGPVLKTVTPRLSPVLATFGTDTRLVRDPTTCCNGSSLVVPDPTTACKPTDGQSAILSVNGHNYVGSWVVTYNQPDGFAAILSVSGADGYFTVNFNVNAYGTITTGIYWVDHGNTLPGGLGPTVNCGPPIVFSGIIDGTLITVTT